MSDVLISELRAILHGSGLGKFEGRPACASWFGTSARPANPRVVREQSDNHTPTSSPATKRPKVSDPGEDARKKALGVFVLDSTVGAGRLPTIDVYAKSKGAKAPERLCMKFLTQGFVCTKENCKSPHIAHMSSLPPASRDKIAKFVGKQASLSWAAGKAPPGTS